MKISDFFTRTESLSADNVRQRIESKTGAEIALVDVREPAEYQVGHLPGAFHVPLSGLLDSLDSMPRDKTVITYCKRGPRSRSAAVMMKDHGFDNIYYMEGGMDAWNGNSARGHYEAGLSILDGKEGTEDLIALAWTMEDSTCSFYRDVKGIMNDSDTANLLESLIRSERKHRTELEKAYTLITGQTLDVDTLRSRDGENIIESGISSNEVIAWIKHNSLRKEEVYELLMQIETNSLDLYMKMLRKIDDLQTRQILDILIEEEKVHLREFAHLLEANSGH